MFAKFYNSTLHLALPSILAKIATQRAAHANAQRDACAYDSHTAAQTAAPVTTSMLGQYMTNMVRDAYAARAQCEKALEDAAAALRSTAAEVALFFVEEEDIVDPRFNSLPPLANPVNDWVNAISTVSVDVPAGLLAPLSRPVSPLSSAYAAEAAARVLNRHANKMGRFGPSSLAHLAFDAASLTCDEKSEFNFDSESEFGSAWGEDDYSDFDSADGADEDQFSFDLTSNSSNTSFTHNTSTSTDDCTQERSIFDELAELSEWANDWASAPSSPVEAAPAAEEPKSIEDELDDHSAFFSGSTTSDEVNVSNSIADDLDELTAFFTSSTASAPVPPKRNSTGGLRPLKLASTRPLSMDARRQKRASCVEVVEDGCSWIHTVYEEIEDDVVYHAPVLNAVDLPRPYGWF